MHNMPRKLSHLFGFIGLLAWGVVCCQTSLAESGDSSPVPDQQQSATPDDTPPATDSSAAAASGDPLAPEQQPLLDFSTHSQRNELSLAGMRASAAHLDWFSWQQYPSDDMPVYCPCQGRYIEPARDYPESDRLPDDAVLRIIANNVNFSDEDHALFSGEVDVFWGQRSAASDELRLNQKNDSAEALGNIILREPGILVRGTEAFMDLENGEVSINEAQYVAHDQQIRGTASQVSITSDDRILLSNGSYSRCAPGENQWQLKASRISIDNQEGIGRASHARVYIEDVPVLYIPYIEFPVDDRRKTGLLWPAIGTNAGGLDLALPYYLNLAPNYDMTLIPRYINDHGVVTGIEGRYLHSYGEWVLAGTYIDDDEQIDGVSTADHPELDSKRWSAALRQDGRLGQHWRTYINYNAVSDADYFRDLGTNGLEIQRSTQLLQTIGLRYFSSDWRMEAAVTSYQSIYDLEPGEPKPLEPYTLAPRITLSKPNIGKKFQLTPLVDAEYTFFDHREKPRVQRLYLEPGLGYPMVWPGAFIKPEAKVRHIHYEFNDSNDVPFSSGNTLNMTDARSVTAGSFNVDTGLIFERPLEIRDNQFLQTLEPRLFYLYTEEADQYDSPNLDTIESLFGYGQIFRQDRFYGNDRIGDANQLGMGVSSSIYNDQGKKLLSASIGQIHYFKDRLITAGKTLSKNDPDAIDDINLYKRAFRNNSDIAANGTWIINKNHSVYGSYIWDPYNKKPISGGLAWSYMAENLSLYNVKFNYSRPFQLLRPDGVDDPYGFYDPRKQTDVSTVVPISERWSLIARWNYDWSKKEAVEEILGFEYDSCCWRATLVYQRERETIPGLAGLDSYIKTIEGEYDYAVMLQIDLKGLAGVSTSVTSLLIESIPGYSKREKMRN